MEQIHGHEVIQMMLDSGKGYTRESLLNDIQARFGADTRFYTCSAENLTAEGLVDFLEAKGKLQHAPQGFQIAAGKICNH